MPIPPDDEKLKDIKYNKDDEGKWNQPQEVAVNVPIPAEYETPDYALENKW